MHFRTHASDEREAIVSLFESAFADSAGESEGALIGGLVRNLFEKTDERDLLNFVAESDGQLVGSIFFSRLRFEPEAEAFILSPVAVRTDYQRQGIGQALILHGLEQLKTREVVVVLTYGDPQFYGKVGFRQISDKTIRPPFQLSQPEGWLGQSLTADPIEDLSGNFRCVEALSDPAYW